MHGTVFSRRRLLSIALLAACVAASHQAVPWEARHGLSAAQYQSTMETLESQGYRLTDVSAYTVSGRDRFAAIWEQRAGPPWRARHDLTSSQYQAVFDEYGREGWRLTHVSGYELDGQARYAAIWEQRGGPAMQARHGLTASQYQQAFGDLVRQGYRLSQVNGYSVNGRARYAAIWERKPGPAWEARHGLTASEFQSTFDGLSRQRYRLTHVSGYTDGGQPRYAAIWQRSSGPAWQARHGLSARDYQATFNSLGRQGYRLVNVSGFGSAGSDYYSGIWEKPLAPSDYPTTGRCPAAFAAFDQAMRDFMAARGMTAGALAVMKDGVMLCVRGYGWRDEAKSAALPTNALLRLASVVKPFTAAAVKKLISEKRLSGSDPVFCLRGSPSSCRLDITPFGSPDPRAAQITIQHLLDHAGGWSREASGDPMFDAIGIAGSLGISSPPDPRDIARFMLGRPLDFTPGTDNVYSNFGYMLLGLVIEEVSGIPYTSYIQSEIVAPAGVPAADLRLARSLPGSRNAREPWYSDDGFDSNVFDPDVLVPSPDGGFHIEAMAAHGGLIASASAVARFLDEYWISGDPRVGNGPQYTFFGSLPGTWSMARQRADGYNIVALFNRRSGDDEQIRALLDAATATLP